MFKVRGGVKVSPEELEKRQREEACARGEHEPMELSRRQGFVIVVPSVDMKTMADPSEKVIGHAVMCVCRHCKAVYFKYEEV